MVAESESFTRDKHREDASNGHAQTLAVIDFLFFRVTEESARALITQSWILQSAPPIRSAQLGDASAPRYG